MKRYMITKSGRDMVTRGSIATHLHYYYKDGVTLKELTDGMHPFESGVSKASRAMVKSGSVVMKKGKYYLAIPYTAELERQFGILSALDDREALTAWQVASITRRSRPAIEKRLEGFVKLGLVKVVPYGGKSISPSMAMDRWADNLGRH